MATKLFALRKQSQSQKQIIDCNKKQKSIYWLTIHSFIYRKGIFSNLIFHLSSRFIQTYVYLLLTEEKTINFM